MKKSLLLTFALLFMCIFFASAENSNAVDSLNSLIKKTLSQSELTADQRLDETFDIMGKFHLNEANIELCGTIINDFILQEVENEELQNRWMTRKHLLIATCYEQMQNNDSLERHTNLALEYIDKTLFDSFMKGLAYQHFANVQQRIGSIQTAHEYYWKAINVYENLNAYLSNRSFCYYQLAIGYYQMHDTDGMRKIMAKMKKIASQNSDKRLFYDYYSVCSAYYTILSEDQPDKPQLMDSIIKYDLKSIQIIETMSVEEMLVAQIQPVWNYFNHAVYYDDAKNIDSIEKYLDKAEDAVVMMGYKGASKTECDISISDLRAWVLFYKGEYDKAEKKMLDVIQMLDTVDSYTPNTVIIEREQAYIFMVNLYQETGKLQKALSYQQLLNELTKSKFDIEKSEALHELTVKYEVEKQDCEISRLTLENEATRKALWLTIIIITFCVFAILFLIVILRLRRKNAEGKIYEAALESEITQQELRNIRQHLNETPNKTLILSVIDAVKQSPLDSNVKAAYLEKLNNFIVEDAEKIFLLAKQKLTAMDKKYIICFMTGMEIMDLCKLFNIEPDSVYMVRYRIKKKFDKNSNLPF